MIQNYNEFSKHNTKSSKIYTLKNSYLFNNMINTKHVIYLGNIYIFNNVAKKIINFFFHMKKRKGLKKDS
jgi:hypothetical protein